MELNYKILFSVELLHDYFVDGKARNVSLSPAYDTLKIFDSLGILWRNIENKYFALIEINQNGEPALNRGALKRYRTMLSDKIFRFYLKTTDPYFLNYSNLNYSGSDFYLFDNLSENIFGEQSSLYLSKKIGAFNSGKEYAQGTYALHTSENNVYESLLLQHSVSLNQKLNWRNKGAKQFVTDADKVKNYFGSTYNFSLNTPLVKNDLWPVVKIYSFNPGAAATDAMVLVKEIAMAEVIGGTKVAEPVGMIPVSLEGIPAGLCKVQVGDEYRQFYYDKDLRGISCFGVVEVFNHLKANQAFSFLDEDEKVVGKEYTIRFPNRSVLWKYIRKEATAAEISDTSDEFSFLSEGGSFVSNIPVPLEEKVRDTFSMKLTEENKTIAPLPNATVYRLSRNAHESGNQSNLCSEIYLNY